MCALHDVPVWSDDHLWVALAAPPPYHSVVKTLTPGVGRDAVLAAMERHERGSVADSFGTLDLAPDGFDLIIDATWVLHEGFADAVWPEGWSLVREPDLLAAWCGAERLRRRAGPGRAGPPGVPGADPALPAAYPWPARWSTTPGPSPASPTSGRPDDAITSLDHADLLACLAVLHPGRAVTDYAWGDDLPPLLDAGYVGLGPQRVWAGSWPGSHGGPGH